MYWTIRYCISGTVYQVLYIRYQVRSWGTDGVSSSLLTISGIADKCSGPAKQAGMYWYQNLMMR
jgi:hypothetical protein